MQVLKLRKNKLILSYLSFRQDLLRFLSSQISILLQKKRNTIWKKSLEGFLILKFTVFPEETTIIGN